LRKFRRQFPVAFFLVKIVLIWYLVVFSVSYLTSGTAAHFYDEKEAESKILAGYWADGWDGSSLSFIQNGNDNIKSCDSVEIAVEIENNGDGDMISGTSFEVYYIENGNPEKQGERIGEGKIPALKSNQSSELIYLAQQPGTYAFLVQQPEGHPESETIWSKWVMVNCPPGKGEQVVEEEQDSAEMETEEQNQDPDSNEDSNIEESEIETETSEDDADINEPEEEETEKDGDES
jgi:TasA anchoring/assembly protein